MLKPKRALLSVSDKEGILALAKALEAAGIEILSTGGTAQLLKAQNITVTEVSDYTGQPEILDGRVKTLHPKVHGGLLALRDNPKHQAALAAHDIEPIDMLVVNLYPFEEVIRGGASFEEAIENIDIGGPAMIRAAAKNHAYVCVVVDPADYAEVIAELDGVSPALLRRLGAKAYARTAAYDSAITRWFSSVEGAEKWPAYVLDGKRVQTLRYGENPHQSAAFYQSDLIHAGLAHATQLQGKELSYNNINDTDAAFALVNEFDGPAVAIIKHANPCGVAVGDTLSEAFSKALACDPVSAYGGILAVNRELDASLVYLIGTLFLEVIIAPSVSEEAAALLSAKKNLRVLVAKPLAESALPEWQVKSVSGGYLVQDSNNLCLPKELKTASKRQPTDTELQDLRFAFTVCKHVESNAIVLAKNGTTIGIGAGQMSRVDSVRIACHKAKEFGLDVVGAVLASDAFFPFADNVHLAAEAGISALIHPGGSIRDEEVVAAADEHGLAMVMTGIRRFNH